MKNLRLLLTFTALMTASVLNTISAQVTIGSAHIPAKAAILEIKNINAANPTSINDDSNITSDKGGLGLPRVKLINKKTLEPFVNLTDADWTNAATTKIKEKHAGLMVYNIHVSPNTETNTDKTFTQGVYVWNGAQWIKETKDDARYFFIPSFNIPLAAVGTGLTCDLYAQYAKQFTKGGNTTFVSSNPAITTIPSPRNGRLYAKGELDYAITYYDANILANVSIDANGVMTYDIISVDTTPDSFLNVVFVIK